MQNKIETTQDKFREYKLSSELPQQWPSIVNSPMQPTVTQIPATTLQTQPSYTPSFVQQSHLTGTGSSLMPSYMQTSQSAISSGTTLPRQSVGNEQGVLGQLRPSQGASYTIPLKGEGGRVITSQGQSFTPQSVVGYSTLNQPQLSTGTTIYGSSKGSLLANPVTVATGMQPQGITSYYSGGGSARQSINYVNDLAPKSKVLQSGFLHGFGGDKTSNIDQMLMRPSGGSVQYSNSTASTHGHLDHMRGSHDERQNTRYLIPQMESPEIGKMHLAERLAPTYNQSPNGDFQAQKDDPLFVPSNRNVDSLADIDEEQEDEDEKQDPNNIESIQKSAREIKDLYALAMHNNIDETQAELIEEYKRRSTLSEKDGELNWKASDLNSPPATGKINWDSKNPQLLNNKRIPGFESDAVKWGH